MDTQEMIEKIKNTVEKNKKYISDYAYNIGATLLLQVVLQLIIYPFVNYRNGEEVLGNIVYYMSVVYIFAQSIGFSLCQTRLVSRKEYETTNGDYGLLLLIMTAVAVVAGALFLSSAVQGIELFGVLAVIAITTCRFYCAVEYRLSLNFRICLVFFCVISAGYLVGTLLYCLTEQWYLIFITGELAGVLYIVCKGRIFKPEPRSENTAKLTKAVLILCVSSLLTYSLENLDRIILINLIDATAVSVYYAVSLVGKTMLMFVGPVSTIILSYISASKRTQTRAEFLRAFRLYTVVGIAFYLMCLVGTPLFVWLFYPNLFDYVNGLNIVVNAAQILSMVASFSIVLILNTLGAKWHLGIHAVYAAVYIPLATVLTMKYGIQGYAWAALISGCIKCIITFVVGSTKFVAVAVPKEEER